MAANAKPNQRPIIRSYANSDPELARGTPVSLRELRALRETFDDERDPRLRASRERAKLSEAERRRQSVEWEKKRKAKQDERGDGERGDGDGRGEQEGRAQRGSGMVGKDRPRPELRPKHEKAPIRESFNQAWLKEEREARMAQYQRERAANDRGTDRDRAAPMPSRGLER